MAEEMSVIGAESGSDLGQELNISLSEADIDEILGREGDRGETEEPLADDEEDALNEEPVFPDTDLQGAEKSRRKKKDRKKRRIRERNEETENMAEDTEDRIEPVNGVNAVSDQIYYRDGSISGDSVPEGHLGQNKDVISAKEQNFIWTGILSTEQGIAGRTQENTDADENAAADINADEKSSVQSKTSQYKNGEGIDRIIGDNTEPEKLYKLPPMTESYDSRAMEPHEESGQLGNTGQGRISPDERSSGILHQATVSPETGISLEAVVNPSAFFWKITGSDIRENLERAGEHIESSFRRMLPQDENEAGRGYSAMKNHFMYQWGQILIQNAGTASAAKCFLQQEKMIASLTSALSRKLMDVNGYSGTDTGLTAAALNSLRQHELAKKLRNNGFSLSEVHQILKNRKDIYERIALRAELQRTADNYPQAFKEGISLNSSDRFFDTGNYQEIAPLISRYLRLSGLSEGFVNKIEGLSAKQLELLSGRSGSLYRKNLTYRKEKAPRIRSVRRGIGGNRFLNRFGSDADDLDEAKQIGTTQEQTPDDPYFEEDKLTDRSRLQARNRIPGTREKIGASAYAGAGGSHAKNPNQAGRQSLNKYDENNASQSGNSSLNQIKSHNRNRNTNPGGDSLSGKTNGVYHHGDVGFHSPGRMQKAAISYLGKAKKNREAQRRISRGIQTTARMASAFSRYAIQGSENGRTVLNALGEARTSVQVYRVGKAAAFYSAVFLSKPTKLAGKIGLQSVRTMGGLLNKVPAIQFVTNKASVGINLVRNTAGNVKKTATAPLRAVQYGFRNVKASMAEKRIQRKERVAGGIRRTANRFVRTVSQTKLGRAAVTTGRAAGFAGKALLTPFRLTAKAVNLMKRGFRRIVAVCSAFLAAAIFLYLIAVFLVAGLNALLEFASGSLSAGEEVFQEIQDFHESVILYKELSDMHRDVDMLEELNRERREAAAEMGQGRPKDPNVLYGHTIDRYGSPDNSLSGCSIHYMDGYGREIPSGSSNSKDIISLAAAMVDNEISYYDLDIFEALLIDMYAMMNPDYRPGESDPWQFSYKESDPYICAYGCASYSYACNDHSAYTKWREMAASGCGSYVGLAVETTHGCQVDESGYLSDHEDWLFMEPDYPSPYDYEDEEGYYLALDEYYEAYNDWLGGEPEWESYYYCPGHFVPTCYGHKDIDIYVTLYDLHYVTDNNLYPPEWEGRPYADMIRGFVENGGFIQEKSVVLAENYYNNDWLSWYNLPMEGSGGFGVVDPLSEEEIEDILARFGGDSDAVRDAIVQYALEAVGKIPYYYGGHNALPGYEGNHFGSTVSPDAKGRTKKGLDCSGFVQWVYKSTAGAGLPSTTAGYAGFSTISRSQLKPGDLGFKKPPGAEDNHIGIYIGTDENGNDLWVHCTGQPVNNVVVNSYGFRFFVSPLG